ncbi:hypothetical protein, partial [Klebsiella pneumoniae]|uniref:hypothetical protein n=1 Tax=Klebsiella pneumoniae TaxID=573 RepID=UPI003F5262C0
LDPDGVLDEFPEILEERLATDDKAEEAAETTSKTAAEGQDAEDEFMEDSDDDERSAADSGKLLDRLFDEALLPKYAFPTDVATFSVFE